MKLNKNEFKYLYILFENFFKSRYNKNSLVQLHKSTEKKFIKYGIAKEVIQKSQNFTAFGTEITEYGMFVFCQNSHHLTEHQCEDK